jgi:hypothetical protein
VGGVFRLLFPQQVTEVGQLMLASRHYMLTGGLVTLILGAALSYFGYFA